MALFNHLTPDWLAFKASPPGRRFQDVYHRREKKAAAKGEKGAGVGRGLWIGAGVLLIAAGIVLAFMPGPGSLVMLGGVAIIARELLPVAKFLDRMEVWGRPHALRFLSWWRGLSANQRKAFKGSAAVLALVVVALFFLYAIR